MISPRQNAHLNAINAATAAMLLLYLWCQAPRVSAAAFPNEVFNAGTHRTPLKAKQAILAQSPPTIRQHNYYLDCTWKYHEEHEIGAVRTMCSSLNGPNDPENEAWKFVTPEKGTVVMGAIVSVKNGVTDVAKDIPFCQWNVYCKRNLKPHWYAQAKDDEDEDTYNFE